MPIRLTDEEAGQMAVEMREVLYRWSEVGRDGDGPRRTYLGFAIVLPHQPDLGRDPARVRRA